jgi:hypothetical protein
VAVAAALAQLQMVLRVVVVVEGLVKMLLWYLEVLELQTKVMRAETHQ